MSPDTSRTGASRIAFGRWPDQRRSVYGSRNDYYYATRDPLGTTGDFTTAPEISQMFGELVGAALADAGVAPDRPRTPFMPSLDPVAELSPPMRCASFVRRGFAGDVHLVETSPDAS